MKSENNKPDTMSRTLFLLQPAGVVPAHTHTHTHAQILKVYYSSQLYVFLYKVRRDCKDREHPMTSISSLAVTTTSIKAP